MANAGKATASERTTALRPPILPQSFPAGIGRSANQRNIKVETEPSMPNRAAITPMPSGNDITAYAANSAIGEILQFFVIPYPYGIMTLHWRRLFPDAPMTIR